jgi:hypothetical protein
MIKFHFLFILSIAPLILFGQSQKYGEVSMKEMEMKYYEKDTAANAVILFDIGETRVDPSMGTKFVQRTRIKIFKKGALDLANVKISAAKGGITKVKAATYNLEDGVIKRYDVPDTMVYKTKITKDIDKKSFALANVSVGSIIEYEYTIRDGTLFYPSWQFQYEIPCMFSEYSLHTDENDFVTHLRGENQALLNHVEKYEGKYHIWTMENIPAFISEPLMPDKDIYTSSIDFALKKTWMDVCSRLLKSQSFGYLAFDKFQSVFGDEIRKIRQITDDETKIKAILELVRNNVAWDGYSDFYASGFDFTLKRKKGSTGDINILLANLLHKVDYDVNLILLSTRDHGLIIKEFESVYQFNYVVCNIKLPNKDIYLDATEKLLPFNMLPKRCYNHMALSLSEKEMAWTKIEPSKEKVFISGNFSLDESGELTGTFNYSNFEYAAFETRKLQKELSEEEFNKRLFKETSWSLKKVKTQGLENIDLPLIEDFEVTIPDFGTSTGNMLYINPTIFFREESSPFTAEKRNYPISLDLPEEKTVTMSITIPENYAIEEVPKNQIVGLPNNAAKYIYSIAVTGNKIQITSKFQLNETVFMPDEYPGLKEFYKRLVAKQAESIVLKRIK